MPWNKRRSLTDGLVPARGSPQMLEALMAESNPPASVQERLNPNTDEVFHFMSDAAHLGDDLPAHGSAERDRLLRKIWKTEPILAGAVSSMVQKMISLGWSLTGGRNRVAKFSDVLVNAEDGAGWVTFLSKLVQDYLTQDIGGFFELGRATPEGAITDLYNLDAGMMRLTGSRNYPAIYQQGRGGRPVPMGRDDFVHMSSLPSPAEGMNDTGFCAVSRAIKAAKLLMSLHTYDEEKLLNMPPKGIASITGLSATAVRAAIKQYNSDRAVAGNLTFPGVLWLAGAATDEIKVNMTPFSTLPENFDREVIVTLYVYTLALAFGVDAREFWPATVTGATKADALIQAQKAKGKGPGELISSMERAINFKVLPPGVFFEFAFQDDEEDRLAAEIAGMRIDNVSSLVSSEILDQEQALRLLVAQRVLPETFATPAYDTFIDFQARAAVEEEDIVTVRFDSGNLRSPFAVVPMRSKSKHIESVTVDKAQAEAIAGGSEIITLDTPPPDDTDVAKIVHDGQVYATVLFQTLARIDGHYVGKVRVLDTEGST